MTELRTRLARELAIEYPIFSAGIGMAAVPELAAAVSNAGGFGVVGASAYEPDRIGGLVERIRQLTEKPFGLNFIIDDRHQSADEIEETRQQVKAAIAERPAVVVLFWGDPRPFVDAAHEFGVKLFIQVGSLEEAKSAAEAGVDGIIAQGVEAGGHVRGTTSIWTLLPETVQAIRPVPVLASGGIGDGAGIARALQLGAQGVSLGTRFVASDECDAHPSYKRRVVESTARDTVLLDDLFDVWWPEAPHRVIRNRIVDEWVAAGRPPSGKRPGEGTPIGKRRMSDGQVHEWPRYAIGVATPDFDGDLEDAPLWAGESCSVVNDIKPAADIVRDLAREAGEILSRKGVPA
jgi:NAD(P)H-dependent flavin oxidoreductase YrpB (nitropropane dioxygenase family)